MNFSIKLFCLFLVFFIVRCKPNNELEIEPTKIDFSKTENETYSKVDENIVPKEFKIAISAIISPRESLEYYKHLIKYLEDKTGVKFKVVQRETYQEVNLMLRNNNVNLAFICSGAYIEERNFSDIEILTVPLVNGKPFYQAYIITNKNSSIEAFSDLKGKSFAFTDPLSNTGKLYAVKRLKDLGYTEDNFFSSTTFSNGHDNSIQLVSKGLIDAATIDGLIYDYLNTYNSERVSNLKIIETSEYFGIPPVVVPANLDIEIKTKIKTTLLNMHKDTIGMDILEKLLIDEFIEGNDENYNSIRAMKKFLNE